jgi:H+/gluconate symporter-like permease
VARRFKGHEKLAAVLSIAVIQSVFTMGGISLFVVTFTVVYIAKDLFTELNIPWKALFRGTIGSATLPPA